MSRVKVVAGASSEPSGRRCAGRTSGARLNIRRWQPERVQQRRDELAVAEAVADVRLERVQRAAGLDQQERDVARADRVLRDRSARGEHDVGAAEADDEAGHSFLSQIELGRLSFAERACKSRRHGVPDPFIGHSATQV